MTKFSTPEFSPTQRPILGQSPSALSSPYPDAETEHQELHSSDDETLLPSSSLDQSEYISDEEASTHSQEHALNEGSLTNLFGQNHGASPLNDANIHLDPGTHNSPSLSNSSPSALCPPSSQCLSSAIIPCSLEPIPHLQTSGVPTEDLMGIDAVANKMGLQTVDDNGTPTQLSDFFTEKPSSSKQVLKPYGN